MTLAHSALGPLPPYEGPKYQRLPSQPENPFSRLIPHQTIAVIPTFTLESGHILNNVPVAYTTKGRLNTTRDNALVICHALSGSADCGDWWGPLIGGKSKAFDSTRFFLICLNSLGSPYGTASPVTNVDGDPGKGRYGPDFPLTTVRDDVRLHKLILDDLGVRQVAAAVGGSMGGMLVLEWAFLGSQYVRSIVAIATSARHSAWCIGVGEVQRQAIYCDPKYQDGYYELDGQPVIGLGTARQHAMMMYRSALSFQNRFDRKPPDPSRAQKLQLQAQTMATRPRSGSTTPFAIHNDGHAITGIQRPHGVTNGISPPRTPPLQDDASNGIASFNTSSSNTTTATNSNTVSTPPSPPTTTSTPLSTQAAPLRYSVQDYLTYQRKKFTSRFDANCYISITRKLDTHDISVHASPSSSLPPPLTSLPTPASDLQPSTSTLPTTTDPLPPILGSSSAQQANGSISTDTPQAAVHSALQTLSQPALILGIESDGLFKLAEQEEIAAGIPNSRLKLIESQEGHDAFLLEFEQVNGFVKNFFAEVLGGVGHAGKNGIDNEVGGDGDLGRDDLNAAVAEHTHEIESEDGFKAGESRFGESEGDFDAPAAEGDITAW